MLFFIASDLLSFESKVDFSGLDSFITTFKTLFILQYTAQTQAASENFLISQ